MRYSNAVINLVGKDNHTRNFSLNQVHVDGAARIARCSKEVGVERLVHVSALCQNPNPPSYVWRPSEFMKSKAAGEQEVLRERPDATIFRPADMWGEMDRFLNYYAGKRECHLHPVFVDASPNTSAVLTSTPFGLLSIQLRAQPVAWE